MKIVAVIPARWESSRLKGKILADINGKPMIQHVWERVKKAHNVDEVVIAVDKDKVQKVVQDFGAKAVFTSPDQPSGTDRIAEAMRDIDVKVVLNIQADEPLIHHSIIDRLAQEMLLDQELVMATVKKRIDYDGEINNPNVVKVVTNREDCAIYFSRSPIPFYREEESSPKYYKHLGIYAYTKDFLYTFKNLPVSPLESAEKLEQLRVLEAGYKIKVLETQFDSCGVDTEDDLYKAESLLSKRKNI